MKKLLVNLRLLVPQGLLHPNIWQQLNITKHTCLDPNDSVGVIDKFFPDSLLKQINL